VNFLFGLEEHLCVKYYRRPVVGRKPTIDVPNLVPHLKLIPIVEWSMVVCVKLSTNNPKTCVEKRLGTHCSIF
jgi:hypothetical protein